MISDEQRQSDRIEVLLKEKKDLQATHRLWHKRMRVLVPRYATLTPEQIKMYGTCYSTALTKEDRTEYNQEMVYFWMSPIRQILMYAEGIPIAYPNRMLAIEVYQDIKLHVSNWSKLLTRSLNRRVNAPPVEDFDLMLEFAENLEAYLEYYYHHTRSKEFEPFHKRTMNRFVNTDRYMHREDSTYTKLRNGIYGFTGERVPRKETPVQRVSTNSTNDSQSHYQDQPMLTEADLVGFNVRGGNEG